MSKFIQTLEEAFGTANLYEVLDLTSDASAAQVRKAYYRASLKVHPDRVGADQKTESTEKFQALSYIYSVLSDTEKRATYDETGEVDGALDSAQDKDWEAYWRLLYQKISVYDIKQFELKYKDSQAELDDLKQSYVDHSGDMDLIMDSVLCARMEDEERFTTILKDMIKKKEVKSFPKFTKETKAKKQARRKRAEAEMKEAEEYGKELGLESGGSEESLRNAIMKRNEEKSVEFNSLISSLEEKYVGKKSKKTEKKVVDPPAEAEPAQERAPRGRGAKKRDADLPPETGGDSDDAPKVKRGRKPKPKTDVAPPEEESVPKLRGRKKPVVVSEDSDFIESKTEKKRGKRVTSTTAPGDADMAEEPPVVKAKRGRKPKAAAAAAESEDTASDAQQNGGHADDKPKAKPGRKKKVVVFESEVEPPTEPAQKPAKKGRKKADPVSDPLPDPPVQVKPTRGRNPKNLPQSEEEPAATKPKPKPKTQKPKAKKVTAISSDTEEGEKEGAGASEVSKPAKKTATKRKTTK